MTLKLNGSSSGYTAIDAPASAGSNTLVLPANNGSAGQILQTDGSGNLTWVDKPTAGLSNATQFQLTSNEFNDTDPMTNWGLALETGQGTLGTAVTHSSGVFTFPDEGYWLVTVNGQLTTGVAQRYSSIQISITTNNGTGWTIVSRGFGSAGELHSANNMDGAHATALVDVTDKAQVKVRFGCDFEDEDVNNYFYGATDSNYTTCQFLRLGAT